MASSRPHKASSSRVPYSYQAFLSFRGKDTRNTFTDHLYTALTNAGIKTFRDGDELQKGENIELALQKAIKESKISIVVFSTNYASSRWCLDELVKILEHKRSSSNHIILPIFYHILPAQVRHQIGSFSEAFVKHCDTLRSQNEEKKRQGMEKVERWKAALSEVANMSGMELQDGQEAKFVQDVVKVIVTKLNRSVLRVPDHLVGMQYFVSDINSWVRNGSREVDIMVIHGMGGIGKTTIAKLVYNMNFDSFEGSSFLANFRDTSKQPNGLVCLQKQLISDILRGRKEKIYNVDEGAIKIRDVVSCKRVLLVLDDVDQLDRLDVVIGMRHWFHSGSKIIITTRCKHFPRSYEVCKIYKVKNLNFDESLQLFSWHAFGQDHPDKGLLEHSKTILQYCGGVPLALKVIGSSLSGKSLDLWVSRLEKLERIADENIVDRLKISYDDLPDNDVKNVFLHIACFFDGECKDWTIKVLDSCDLQTTVAIDYLIDRCLLEIDYDDKLSMHQLIRDMGKDIVRQESPDGPEKRSRLWHPKDCFSVLSEKIGTIAIKALGFDMRVSTKYQVRSNCSSSNMRKRRFVELLDNSFLWFKSQKRRASNFLSWHPIESNLYEGDFETNAFKSMKQLKLLKLNYVKLQGSYKELPKHLIWLCWHGFHLASIPNDLFLESLVMLDIQFSNLKQAWQGNKRLPSLKILNLSHSKWLSRTPNLSGAPNLEKLILKDCISLVSICESIGFVERLASLDLSDCTSLKELPSIISRLRCLESLTISGCSGIVEFPMWLVCMESLREFNANRTNAFIIPLTRGLTQWSLPGNLRRLCLTSCNLSDACFPRDFSNLPNLEYLNLDGNLVRGLPICIRTLNKLKELRMSYCPLLQSVEGLPSSLQRLDVYSNKSLETIRNTSNLLSIKTFGCVNLVEVQGRLKCACIKNVDKRILKNLGLLDFQLEEEVLSKIKVYYEYGIFSTYFGGRELVESCCDFVDRTGWTTISFKIPDDSSNRRILGLNVCVAYHHSYHNMSGVGYEVTNMTTNIGWLFAPVYVWRGSRASDEITLSHWRFGDLLQAGDLLIIKVREFEVMIKEVGVKVVYQEEEDYSEWKDTNFAVSWTEGDEGTHYYTHLRYPYEPDGVLFSQQNLEYA